MVEDGLKYNLIHNSTYGSVPCRTAQDAVMEKFMSIDMMRVQKMSGAIFNCDAKGFCDRIVVPLQSIASRSLGAPKEVAIFFARFWRGFENYVRTKHGISNTSYPS